MELDETRPALEQHQTLFAVIDYKSDPVRWSNSASATASLGLPTLWSSR